jgi:hypothetical protein
VRWQKMLNAAVLEHTRNKMFAGADLGDLKIWQVMDGDRDHSKGAHSGWCCQRDCRVELGCDTGGEGGEEQSRHKDPPPGLATSRGRLPENTRGTNSASPPKLEARLTFSTAASRWSQLFLSPSHLFLIASEIELRGARVAQSSEAKSENQWVRLWVRIRYYP